MGTDPENREAYSATVATLDPGSNRIAAGTKLGAYQIEALIGEGAMGEVYRGVHVELGRPVALKTLKPKLAADASLLQRFFAEARAVNVIRHENIVECTDMVHDPSGRSYIVMELLDGQTLHDAIVEAGRLPVRRAVAIAAQIAEALAAAHAKDIVHRDLKPENVFLIRRASSADYVKVLDFGIARLRPEMSVNASESGALIGTPAYMSPEQVSGQRAGPASDIYALGVVLYHALVGHIPFSGTSPHMVLLAHVSTPPPRVTGVPTQLADLIERMLAKRPEDRPRDMTEVRAALLATVIGVADDERADAGQAAQHQMALSATIASGDHRDLAVRPAGSRARRLAPWIGVALIAIVAIVLARRSREATAPAVAKPRKEPMRLTDPIAGGGLGATISPDGKLLALVDENRIILRAVDGSTSRELALPSPPRQISWYPDQQRLLAVLPDGPTNTVLADIAVADGAVTRHEGQGCWTAVVAGDGRQIACLDRGGIRILTTAPETSRYVVKSSDDVELADPVWAPDDRYFAYARRSGDETPTIRVVSIDGREDHTIAYGSEISPRSGGFPAYAWLNDGRLLYTSSTADGSRVLAVDLDPARATPRSGPVELLASDTEIAVVNASREGALLYSQGQPIINWYRIDLGAATAAVPRSQVGEIVDVPSGLVVSRMRGTSQLVGPRGIITSFPGTALDPTLVPDRSAVMYIQVLDGSLVLRRTDLAGKTTEQPLAYRPAIPPIYTQQLVVQLACPRRGSAPCVLGATEPGARQVFYAVDPATGARGKKLCELSGVPRWTWGLSPDGQRIVVAHEHDTTIRYIDLATCNATAAATLDMVFYDIAWLDDDSFVIAGGDASQSARILLIAGASQKELWVGRHSEVPKRLVVNATPHPPMIDFRTQIWNESVWLLETR